MKFDPETMIEVLFVVFSAIAAWYAKRNHKQMTPDPQKVGRAANDRQNNFDSKEEISSGDLMVGLLEELNRVHDRLDKIGAPPE